MFLNINIKYIDNKTYLRKFYILIYTFARGWKFSKT